MFNSVHLRVAEKEKGMSKNVIKVVMGLFVMAVFGMAGCGGSGTSSPAPTVSGTASEGTLITGKTVKLKDANGISAIDGTTNSTTGIYSIDVTGLTAPFLVTVTGASGATYVSLAQAAGKANINPITTTVVALAAGNSDVAALFTNLKTSEITTINTNYAAKAALVTSSLQAALPSGITAANYFTGTITAGTGMDAVFDTYRITVNPTNGITVITKDAKAATVLTIPTTTVTANTSQALPTIIIDTNANTPLPTVNYSVVAAGDWTISGQPVNKKLEIFSNQPSFNSSLYLYIQPLAEHTVDFSSRRVALLSLGGRPTGGYSISAEKIEDYGDYIKATVLIKKPGVSCVVTQAQTSPYQFVEVESTKELLFEERVEFVDCK